MDRAIGDADREGAPRDAFDQREPASRPVRDVERNQQQDPEQHRRRCGDRRKRSSTDERLSGERRRRDRHGHQPQHDQRVEHALHDNRAERGREPDRQLARRDIGARDFARPRREQVVGHEADRRGVP